ncbi:hypothetical protein LDENG_00101620 [Lucifuga dentata]|nr:hypothetical protein LDENG_00101620 [Lucifuga dentata]
MIILFLCITFNTILVSGSSLSDKVSQTPAEMYKKTGEATISCSHTIPSYNQILWYHQPKHGQLQFLGYMLTAIAKPEPGWPVELGGSADTGRNSTLKVQQLRPNSSGMSQLILIMITQTLIVFITSFLRLQGHCQDVIQEPEISWKLASMSADMNCSHKRDAAHTQMYWYKQRPGEPMTLIVYTAVGAKQDYGGGVSPDKYSAVKTLNKNVFSGVSLGVQISQTPSEVFRKPGDKVQLVCSHEKTDYTQMYWYQKSPGDSALKRIGHVYYSTIDLEESYRQHFNITGDMSGQTAKNGSLFVVDLKAPDHSAVYYCAASYAHRLQSPLINTKTKLYQTFLALNRMENRLLPASCI